MRLASLCLAVLLVISCGDDSTGSSTGGLPASAVTGSWALTISDSLPCPDTLTDSVITFAITGSDDDIEPGGSLSFASSWTSGGGLTGTVYGTVNVKTEGMLLHITRQDTLGYALEARGTLDGNGILHGVVFDPYPGYQPLLVTGSCTFTATATRTSS